MQESFFIYFAHSNIPKNHSVMNMRVRISTKVISKIFSLRRFIIIEVGSRMLTSTSNMRNMMVIKKKLVEKTVFFEDSELKPHSKDISLSLEFIVFSLILEKILIRVMVMAANEISRI